MRQSTGLANTDPARTQIDEGGQDRRHVLASVGHALSRCRRTVAGRHRASTTVLRCRRSPTRIRYRLVVMLRHKRRAATPTPAITLADRTTTQADGRPTPFP